METFLFLSVPLLIMYALIVIPQQRRDKKKREMVAALLPGDEVLTSSGFYGVITDFDGPTVFLALDEGVEVKMSKEAIVEKVDYDETV